MSYVPTLRAVRAHFGLTQQELAGWLGLSRSAYSVVEAGREVLPAHARAWLQPWATALSYPSDERVKQAQLPVDKLIVLKIGRVQHLTVSLQRRRHPERVEKLEVVAGQRARRLLLGKPT